MDARVLTAAASHIGRIRMSNQDSGYAGTHLFMVADGMGGHAGGDVASSLATQAVTSVADERFDTIQVAQSTLVDAIKHSAQELSDAVRDHPDLQGMGTTVSAMIRHDDKVVVAHIGDSRIYLFRNKKLEQITTDHTFVQKLVETGRITAEEAAVHPRRNVLMRVLGDFDPNPEVDTFILETEPGDRWLLCSDGLCGYVPDDTVARILRDTPDAAAASTKLIEAALDRGAPDNVTVIIAGVNETNVSAASRPMLVGAAAQPLIFDAVTKRLPKITGMFGNYSGMPEAETFATPDFLETIITEDKKRAARRRLRWGSYFGAALALIVGLAIWGYLWTQSQFYVGTDGNSVVIYRGIVGEIGGFNLNSVEKDTDIPLAMLPEYLRHNVETTITVDSYNAALEVVTRIRNVSATQ
ncbi:MAG: Stp1/IreP family PP2C-type Ser/Thr phosphatase [Microbacteriaceae bacterium]